MMIKITLYLCLLMLNALAGTKKLNRDVLDPLMEYLLRNGRLHELAAIRRTSIWMKNILDSSMVKYLDMIHQVEKSCPERISQSILYYSKKDPQYSNRKRYKPISFEGEEALGCLKAMTSFCKVIPFKKIGMYPVKYDSNKQELIKLLILSCPTQIIDFQRQDSLLRFLMNDIVSRNLTGLITNRVYTDLDFPNLRYLEVQLHKNSDLFHFNESSDLETLLIRVTENCESIDISKLFPGLKNVYFDFRMRRNGGDLFKLPLPPQVESFRLSLSFSSPLNAYLPSGLSSMDNIKEFRLESNFFSSKALRKIEFPRNTEILHLSLNSIKSLDFVLSKLKSLEKVWFYRLEGGIKPKDLFKYIPPNTRNLEVENSVEDETHSNYDLTALSNSKIVSLKLVPNKMDFYQFVRLFLNLPRTCTRLSVLDILLYSLNLQNFKRAIKKSKNSHIKFLEFKNINGRNCNLYGRFFSMFSSMRYLKVIHLHFEDNTVYCEKVVYLLYKLLPSSVEYVDLGFQRNELEAIQKNQETMGLNVYPPLTLIR